VLSLQVAISEQEACARDYGEILVAVVPVDVVASTAEGLVDLSAPGTVHVALADGAIDSLELWLSADFACHSEIDTLPYRAADCSTDERMTAKLDVTYSPRSDSYSAEELLHLFVRRRGSTASPQAFDWSGVLTLAQ
jgi:hypothetical protein